MKTNYPVKQFLLSFDESLKDSSFIKLSLGNYTGTEENLKNIYVRKIIIKRQENLSFTYRYHTRDIVKNYSFAEGVTLIESLIGSGFGAATLFTNDFDLALQQKTAGQYTLKKNKPSQKAPESLEHNRQKNRPIAAGEKPYLHDLNITDASGNVFKNTQDKFRQINKYVEILGGLLKNIPTENIKKIVDMGSGKGYLTFALYDYLTATLGLKPQVTGVEYRQDMVDLCNKIAKNNNFDGLNFAKSSIEEYDSSDANIFIALHACDTATDDALFKAISANADLIVVAPCCHKQIRLEMDKAMADNELAFLTRYGTFMERQSEMVTDGMRALILEYFGYKTKVFEFISDAHTPKNVMIVGTKSPQGLIRNPQALETLKKTKEYFGIGHHHLEKLLEIK